MPLVTVERQARIGEGAEAAHLRDGDVAVPVGNSALDAVAVEVDGVIAVASERDLVDAGEAVRRRDDHWLVQPVDVMPRVVEAFAPFVKQLFLGRWDRRRQRDDRADV